MKRQFLEFEQPIADLELKIEELQRISHEQGVDLGDALEGLQVKSRKQTESLFQSLTAWQVAQLARHPNRPYFMDYAQALFSEFTELRGDRHYADDRAIIGGLARFQGRSVMIMGHQKGRDTKEKLARNFGMPAPEGYRKALRLMKLAEKFGLPVITFIDTPGAYPGIGAEERNQSEAIARNLFEMSGLRTPIISYVMGEGGSGGALAIGVADRVMMLQYSIYSVISPEGCASILWKKAEKAADAAEAMGITAPRLLGLGLIDGIVDEPLGGAHRDFQAVFNAVEENLAAVLQELVVLPEDTLLEQRKTRLAGLGHFQTEKSD